MTAQSTINIIAYVFENGTVYKAPLPHPNDKLSWIGQVLKHIEYDVIHPKCLYLKNVPFNPIQIQQMLHPEFHKDVFFSDNGLDIGFTPDNQLELADTLANAISESEEPLNFILTTSNPLIVSKMKNMQRLNTFPNVKINFFMLDLIPIQQRDGQRVFDIIPVEPKDVMSKIVKLFALAMEGLY